MKLHTADGQDWVLHFKHDSETERKTICKAHTGDCSRSEGEPCQSLPVFTGEAHCADSDQFCRATGRKVSLKRAISHLPRETRRAIWQAYLNPQFCG
jgi:hypothetical protein